MLVGLDRRAAHALGERVEVLAAAPRSSVRWQVKTSVGARRLVQPHHLDKAAAEDPVVERVVDARSVDGVAVAVDRHAPVAAVADEEDEAGHLRAAATSLLVLARRTPRASPSRVDARRGMRGLDQEPVAVLDVGELRRLRPACGAPHQPFCGSS